ncbi:cell division cycle protein 37 [Lycorma delicatula]|uniref:cell division cycle protein 37 n=1 Tax=Lycorma delicatula TaxID=130591 RepID=UPI003F5179C1
MVDYSKWKDIEISDDEDETHPNIDTPSLFRWRHQARIERMEEQRKEKEEFEKTKEKNRKKLEATQKLILEAEKQGGDVCELRKSLADLELEATNLKKKEDNLKLKEKITPWNVDTISKPGFTKTVVNKRTQRKEENLTDEERERRMKEFIKENEKFLKKYGMLRKYEDSKRFLQENPQLVCEDTANYLVIWCINLEMEEKKELSHHVAHQCICMQYILELSKQLDVDPRACVGSFFSKIQIAEPEYKTSFDDELNSFKERVSKRAQEKLEQAVKEVEEEERKARLGPGGLDPLEVLESLPDALKKCFETQDTGLLQETIAKMPHEEAVYHMKRCVDSGLWIPDAKKKQKEEGEMSHGGDDIAGEEIYSAVNDSDTVVETP